MDIAVTPTAPIAFKAFFVLYLLSDAVFPAILIALPSLDDLLYLYILLKVFPSA